MEEYLFRRLLDYTETMLGTVDEEDRPSNYVLVVADHPFLVQEVLSKVEFHQLEEVHRL